MLQITNPLDKIKSVTFDIFDAEHKHSSIIYGINAVIYDIVVYLLTTHGDKLFNLSFGGNLYGSLFEFNVDVLGILAADVKDQLRSIEPRVNILDVTIYKNYDNHYILNVKIQDPSDIHRIIQVDVDINRFI